MIYQTNPMVAMDRNHIHMIHALITCTKPSSVLEIGVGTGLVTNSIIDAFTYNQQPVNLTCVDNFLDWNGNTPIGFEQFQDTIKFIHANEKDFVQTHDLTYDFIISDADHHHTNEWVDKTYNLLNSNGVLIYHDVTNKDFPNLYEIVQFAKNKNIRYSIFDKSTLVDERCDRGLLVIYKD
jgi:predicted O-methyltransferase YrrM